MVIEGMHYNPECNCKNCIDMSKQQKLHEVAQKANQDQRELMEKSKYEEWEKKFDKSFYEIKDSVICGQNNTFTFDENYSQLGAIKQFISQQISLAEERVRKEEREKMFDILTSGKGRDTHVWYYSLNDNNEMKAYFDGKYLSIKESKKNTILLRSLFSMVLIGIFFLIIYLISIFTI